MAKAASPSVEPSSKKLDRITEVLQDLFVLEAAKAEMNKEAVRKILGIGMTRVTRIWKHVERSRDGAE